VGAIDAAALGPFKKQAHGRGNEKSLLCFGCDFSGWYSFGKIIKIVATGFRILKLNNNNNNNNDRLTAFDPGQPG